jgi:hypothetical protein
MHLNSSMLRALKLDAAAMTPERSVVLEWDAMLGVKPVTGEDLTACISMWGSLESGKVGPISSFSMGQVSRAWLFLACRFQHKLNSLTALPAVIRRHRCTIRLALA